MLANLRYAIPASLVWLALLSPLALVQPELFWQVGCSTTTQKIYLMTMLNRSHITINTVPGLYCIVLLIPLIQIEEVFFSWLLSMVACWAWSAGYEVAESGADLDLVIFSPIFCFLN